MKYTRSHLQVVGHDTLGNICTVRVPSICAGEWHIHEKIDALDSEGLVVAHKSGISTSYRGLTPVKAVRVLQAFQVLPPCPVSDNEIRDRVKNGTVKEHEMLQAWIDHARRLIYPIVHFEPGKITIVSK